MSLADRRPRGASLRLLGVHRWLGRVVMLYFAFIFATGTLLVFGLELQAVVSPQMQRQGGAAATAEVNWAGLLDSALERHPGAQPQILRAPQSGFLAAAAEMAEEGHGFVVWADPVTGDYQGVTPARGFHEILRLIHTHLMVEKRPVLILMTAMGLLLLVQVVAGLRSAPRFWRNWGRLPPVGAKAWSVPRSFWGGLHRWVAVWCLPLLVVTVVTNAIYLTEAIGFEQSLPAAKPAERLHEGGLPPGFDGAALAQALRVAEAALPGLKVREVYLPLRSGEGIRVRGDLTATLVRPRANTVTVDPDSFAVLGQHRGEELSTWRRIMELADPLHFGTWGGTASRALWVVMGLMATGLALSGVMIAAHRASPSPPRPSLGAAIGAIYLPARLALAAMFLGVAALLAFTLFQQGF